MLSLLFFRGAVAVFHCVNAFMSVLTDLTRRSFISDENFGWSCSVKSNLPG
jgi:hypothetical protein